ncbi:MAG: hypothetical protein ACFFAU_18520 [Candidatus Hodarchaeota archaeon]
MSSEDFSGTEKWIEVVLKEMKEASTVEIIERVSIFNQDCADRIPMVLTSMRMEGKVLYKVVPTKDGKRQNIVWYLKEPDK